MTGAPGPPHSRGTQTLRQDTTWSQTGQQIKNTSSQIGNPRGGKWVVGNSSKSSSCLWNGINTALREVQIICQDPLPGNFLQDHSEEWKGLSKMMLACQWWKGLTCGWHYLCVKLLIIMMDEYSQRKVGWQKRFGESGLPIGSCRWGHETKFGRHSVIRWGESCQPHSQLVRHCSIYRPVTASFWCTCLHQGRSHAKEQSVLHDGLKAACCKSSDVVM